LWETSLRQIAAVGSHRRVHDQIRLTGLEIGRRIVEREMRVFTDSRKADIDWKLPDQRTQSLALSRGVAIARNVMKVPQRQRQETVETLPEKAAERRGMRDRQPNIFIEVKARDAVPGDVWLVDERLEQLELRCASRDDDVGATSLLDRFADASRSKRSRRSAIGVAVRRNGNFHEVGATAQPKTIPWPTRKTLR